MLSVRTGVRPHLRTVPGCLTGNPCSHGVSAQLDHHRSHLCPGLGSPSVCQYDHHTAPHLPTSLERQSRNAQRPLPGPPRVPASLDWDPSPGHTKAQAKSILPSPLGDALGPGYSGTTEPQSQKPPGPSAPWTLERLGAPSPREKMEHGLRSHSLTLRRILQTVPKIQPSPAPPQGALCLSP